jgi:hypothetical protein
MADTGHKLVRVSTVLRNRTASKRQQLETIKTSFLTCVDRVMVTVHSTKGSSLQFSYLLLGHPVTVYKEYETN